MAELYSVRMRAARGGPHEKGGHHISGAERIVKLEEVGAMVQSLADRALHHSKGTADFINILKRIRFFYAWCYVSRCYNW